MARRFSALVRQPKFSVGLQRIEHGSWSHVVLIQFVRGLHERFADSILPKD